MGKYVKLGEHFVALKGTRQTLTFDQVEQVVGEKLPPVARKHAAWWANSHTKSHHWSHQWQRAGWEASSPNFTDGKVTFTRLSPSATLETLGLLKPATHDTLYDLLEICGISTADWEIGKNGTPIDEPKSNPQYCYNWSFGSKDEGFALCIWHSEIDLENTLLVYKENVRKLSRALDVASRDSAIPKKSRDRAMAQAGRAKAFDDALNLSYSRGLPVRVMLTEGVRREDLDEGSSHVQYRALDPVRWYVHRYDLESGDLILIRGVPAPGVASYEDDEDEKDHSGSPDDIQTRAIKIRRGQPAFRQDLLSAYNRRCAVTGCAIVDLLEAAHIRPHSEEPNYSVSNGLLLRSDIHTLFDVNLLSIDTYFTIHLAPSIKDPAYLGLRGKKIHQPDKPSQCANDLALAARHKVFMEKHANEIAAGSVNGVSPKLRRGPISNP